MLNTQYRIVSYVTTDSCTVEASRCFSIFIRYNRWDSTFWSCMSIIQLDWNSTPSNLVQFSCSMLSLVGGRWKLCALGRLNLRGQRPTFRINTITTTTSTECQHIHNDHMLRKITFFYSFLSSSSAIELLVTVNYCNAWLSQLCFSCLTSFVVCNHVILVSQYWYRKGILSVRPSIHLSCSGIVSKVQNGLTCRRTFFSIW